MCVYNFNSIRPVDQAVTGVGNKNVIERRKRIGCSPSGAIKKCDAFLTSAVS